MKVTCVMNNGRVLSLFLPLTLTLRHTHVAVIITHYLAQRMWGRCNEIPDRARAVYLGLVPNVSPASSDAVTLVRCLKSVTPASRPSPERERPHTHTHTHIHRLNLLAFFVRQRSIVCEPCRQRRAHIRSYYRLKCSNASCCTYNLFYFGLFMKKVLL